VQQKNIIIWYS